MELRVNEVAIPEKIDFNYEELKAELISKVSFYETLVYTDDQIKDAKADKANLNKLKKALNDERIRKEKEYMQPFNVFKAQINEIIGIIDKPIAVIDEQVKAYDEKRKAEKQKAIEDLFSQIGFQNFVTLEKIWDPKWLNASVSMKSIEDQMKSRMYEIGNGVLTLSQLPEFGFEATEVFKETLDINKAISEAKRMSEIAKAKAEAEARRKAEEESRKAAEEARRKAEEERKAQEKVAEEQRAAMAKAMTPPEEVQPTPVQESQPEPQKMVVKFEVELTTEDATALREFFQSRNITFRAIRSFGSKTYQTFLDKFKNVPYKLVATATPSPNKYKELIHYAGYLEVMDTGQALTRFFQRDSTKANNLTLYPNMEDEFWLWVSSWALFITKPSDINPDYSDDGYVLPPLDVRWHEIPIHYGDSVDRDGQMELFTQASTGLKEAAKIKRESIDARVEKMKEIVDSSPEDHFILWHDQEAERHAIKKALPETVDIYGSMDYDLREQRVIDFSNGKTRLFATKKSISGSGCNFQRFCHREIFVGIDYEFNDFIQAVHTLMIRLQSPRMSTQEHSGR